MAAHDAHSDELNTDERAAFFDETGTRSDYLSVDVGDAQFLVKTEDKHIGRALFIKKGRGDIKVLARCVLVLRALYGEGAVEGRTFLEVGANIGTTTLSAILFHPFARAVAIEPEPENFRTLRLNLVLNDVDDRTTAIQAAVSNTLGTLDLVVNRARSGRHWVAGPEFDPGRLDSDDGIAIAVPTVTLDSLVDTGVLTTDEVALLWADAENHEGAILEGASKLVKAGVPAVFEWDPAGLERRGDADTIHAIAGKHYTHFVDMRGSADPQAPRLQLHTIDALRHYRHETADQESHFTEIMVLRLSTEQAAQADDALRSAKERFGGEGPTSAAPNARARPAASGAELLGRLRSVARTQRAAPRTKDREAIRATMVKPPRGGGDTSP